MNYVAEVTVDHFHASSPEEAAVQFLAWLETHMYDLDVTVYGEDGSMTEVDLTQFELHDLFKKIDEET